LFKVGAISAVMGGAGYLMLRVANLIVTTHTVWGLLIQTIITLLVSVLVYLVLARLFKIAEVKMILAPKKLFFSEK